LVISRFGDLVIAEFGDLAIYLVIWWSDVAGSGDAAPVIL
jgi:hypothetical protein